MRSNRVEAKIRHGHTSRRLLHFDAGYQCGSRFPNIGAVDLRRDRDNDHGGPSRREYSSSGQVLISLVLGMWETVAENTVWT